MAIDNQRTEDVVRSPQAGKREGTDGDGESLLLDSDSEQDPTVSVVMPTLNEEAGIAECIERVKLALAELDVSGEVVVSDSSTDRTPEIARELGAIVVEPDREGYGYAYRYGFGRARGDYVVMGDADTTYDFAELPKLYRAVVEDGADIAMGSRLEGEIEDGAMPALHQYVGNPLLTRFLNVFYDADVSDAHSGFRVLTREALEELDLRTDGMEFASEMIMEAAARNLDIVEVPITYHEREGEATLDSFRDGWRHVKFMLVNAPGYLFSAPALVLGTLGVLAMALSLAGVTLSSVSFSIHTMLAGSLLTIVGYQIGSLGIFTSVAADPIRDVGDPVTTWVTRRFRLEHGATVGFCGCLAGIGLASGLVLEWVGSGFDEPPMVVTSIFAFTLVVLGLQTVFNSFFLSTLGEDGRG